MKINRKLQADILYALEEVYPDSLLVQALPDFNQDKEYMANLFYLQEHELIEGGDIREPGQCRSMVDAQITKTGLDFLADDGGLQAILADQKVTFFNNELLEIIEGEIRQSPLDQDEILSILKYLEKLDSISLKKVILKLLGAKDAEKPKFYRGMMGNQVL